MAAQTEATLTLAIETAITDAYALTVAVPVDREILDRSLANVKKGFRMNWRNGVFSSPT